MVIPTSLQTEVLLGSSSNGQEPGLPEEVFFVVASWDAQLKRGFFYLIFFQQNTEKRMPSDNANRDSGGWRRMPETNGELN